MTEKNTWKAAEFAASVIRRTADDTAFAAVMRRADNPNQCSAAWEYLVPFCDLMEDRVRLSFALIGAAIARKKPEANGSAGLGAALRSITGNDAEGLERESRRLRRLIACGTAQELLPVLRPILQYVQEKSPQTLDYERLLLDLLYFGEAVRLRWTREFYHKTADAPQGEASCTF